MRVATTKAPPRNYRRPIAWSVIAGTTLAIGYIDLWRGGQTVSAFTLTIGYLILVPIALMAVPTVNQLANT